jgi:hypothetical protein
LKVKELVRLLAELIVVLGLAVAVGAACLGQDFAPRPGPSAAGLAADLPVPQNQQPQLSLPGPANDAFSPEFPSWLNRTPDLGMPRVFDCDSWLPSASAVLSDQPPVAVGPSADSGGKDNDAGLPDDMLGSGGRGEMGGMSGPGGGMFPVDSARYSVVWLPNVPVQGQPTDFQMVRQDLSFTHPLWKDPLNALSLTGGVRNELIETEAVLPGVGQPVPSDLWGVNLGLPYNRQLDDGWIAGGGVSIGSASDHPFANIHEINIGMNALLRIPQGEHNAWLFEGTSSTSSSADRVYLDSGPFAALNLGLRY